MDRTKIDQEIIRRLRLARNELSAASKALDEHVFEISGLKAGTVVRNKHTGNTYRIDGAHAHMHDASGVSLTLRATRVYATGRRPARSDTYINESDVEVVSDDAS